MTLTKPSKTHTFTNGTIAQAPQVNTNFTDIFGVLEEDAYLAKGWFLIDNASFEYHASNALKTTADVDLTSILQEGDKLTFEQPTNGEYFAFVTKLDYNTTVANRTYVELFVYEQTAVIDEGLEADTVGLSRAKDPWGFPLDEDGWSITNTSNSNITQASPVNGTYYAISGLDIIVPPGLWKIYFSVIVVATNTQTTWTILSTDASTKTDNDLSVRSQIPTTGTMIDTHIASVFRNLSVSTTYTLMSGTFTTGSTGIRHHGGDGRTIVKATIAYL